MKYEFTEQIFNNLMVYLDRVTLTGFKELQAMQEILNILNKPIKEDIKEEIK
jgi:hypothetical protein